VQTGQKTLNPANSLPDPTRPGAAAKPLDPRPALWGFLLLDVWVRLMIWGTSLGLTTAAFGALGAWPEGNPLAGHFAVTMTWARRIGLWVLLFNLVYVLELVVLRLMLPMPREGVYSTRRRGLPDPQLIKTCLIGVLTKARLEAPFPGFLVFHIANLPPVCWLFGRVFGPRSRSCYVTDPMVIDPHLVEIGRNVVVGLEAIIAGHVQESDKVTIKRTVIEDDVVIGGRAIIMGGCHLQKGCIIGAEAVLRPGTVVGPGEFWGGLPAKKIGTARELEETCPAV
jgi:hypothetical protein